MAICRGTYGHVFIFFNLVMLGLGCAGRSPLPERDMGEVLAILRPNEEDIENRYSSVVAFTLSETERPYCSGVLIDPQLALTAAHCVCKEILSADGKSKTFDPSTCKKQASFNTALYRQTSPKQGDVIKRYTGEVLVHPQFKIVLRKEMVVNPGSNVNGGSPVKTMWFVDERSADLALIRLSDAVAEGVSAAGLSKSTVSATNEITITGFGADEVNASGECVYNDDQLTRRFGSNKVVREDPGTKTFTIEKPETLGACGDSGGGSFLNHPLILCGQPRGR